MTLTESIQYVGENKQKSAILAKKIGVVTFSECRELINSGKLDNEGNRDEDLDTRVKYYGKVHHLIRYMTGISEKGQLLVSVLRDSSSKNGYIRDNGTMFSLTFGKYYGNKVLTGNDWLDLCEAIVDEYDITGGGDDYIINMVRNFFKLKKEEQLTFSYSLKEIVESSADFKDFYDNVPIGFVVSLHTVRQFEKDMINCNRQPNPWLAYNYYITPLKRTDEYKTYYCGDQLLEYFTNKPGADTFNKGKLMYGHQGYAEKHKVAKMIPILQAYIGSHYCETIDDFKKFNDMVVAFENGRDDGKEAEYWRNMFKKVIGDVSCSSMIDWYEKQYRAVFESDSWDSVTAQINKIVAFKMNNSKIESMEALHIKKYHTGILMMSIALYFKRKNPKISISKLTEKVCGEYVRLLNGNINHDNEKVPVWKYFGIERDIYKSTNADSRWEKLFKYVFQNVQTDITNRSKDRDREAEYRESELKRISSFIDNENLQVRMKLFPLSTDSLCFVNFSNGDGLHWLHKTPHSMGGDAKDGFLGMIDDNLNGNQKFKNWNCTQSEYWLMVAERNENLLDSLDGVSKKLVKNSIDNIYQLIDGGIL